MFFTGRVLAPKIGSFSEQRLSFPPKFLFFFLCVNIFFTVLPLVIFYGIGEWPSGSSLLVRAFYQWIENRLTA